MAVSAGVFRVLVLRLPDDGVGLGVEHGRNTSGDASPCVLSVALGDTRDDGNPELLSRLLGGVDMMLHHLCPSQVAAVVDGGTPSERVQQYLVQALHRGRERQRHRVVLSDGSILAFLSPLEPLSYELKGRAWTAWDVVPTLGVAVVVPPGVWRVLGDLAVAVIAHTALAGYSIPLSLARLVHAPPYFSLRARLRESAAEVERSVRSCMAALVAASEGRPLASVAAPRVERLSQRERRRWLRQLAACATDAAGPGAWIAKGIVDALAQLHPADHSCLRDALRDGCRGDAADGLSTAKALSGPVDSPHAFHARDQNRFEPHTAALWWNGVLVDLCAPVDGTAPAPDDGLLGTCLTPCAAALLADTVSDAALVAGNVAVHTGRVGELLVKCVAYEPAWYGHAVEPLEGPRDGGAAFTVPEPWSPQDLYLLGDTAAAAHPDSWGPAGLLRVTSRQLCETNAVGEERSPICVAMLHPGHGWLLSILLSPSSNPFTSTTLPALLDRLQSRVFEARGLNEQLRVRLAPGAIPSDPSPGPAPPPGGPLANPWECSEVDLNVWRVPPLTKKATAAAAVKRKASPPRDPSAEPPAAAAWGWAAPSQGATARRTDWYGRLEPAATAAAVSPPSGFVSAVRGAMAQLGLRQLLVFRMVAPAPVSAHWMSPAMHFPTASTYHAAQSRAAAATPRYGVCIACVACGRRPRRDGRQHPPIGRGHRSADGDPCSGGGDRSSSGSDSGADRDAPVARVPSLPSLLPPLLDGSATTSSMRHRQDDLFAQQVKQLLLLTTSTGAPLARSGWLSRGAPRPFASVLRGPSTSVAVQSCVAAPATALVPPVVYYAVAEVDGVRHQSGQLRAFTEALLRHTAA